MLGSQKWELRGTTVSFCFIFKERQAQRGEGAFPRSQSALIFWLGRAPEPILLAYSSAAYNLITALKACCAKRPRLDSGGSETRKYIVPLGRGKPQFPCTEQRRQEKQLFMEM